MLLISTFIYLYLYLLLSSLWDHQRIHHTLLRGLRLKGLVHLKNENSVSVLLFSFFQSSTKARILTALVEVNFLFNRFVCTVVFLTEEGNRHTRLDQHETEIE